MVEFATIKPVIHQHRTFQRRAHARGQMAIFIALIFQVLFVLFAMAINVALVVHDKINLQNAVDLAAYYAAERQAEILNVIAHENYMIRQSWKLLAWRYRVLGAAGNQSPVHPWRVGDMREMIHYHAPPNIVDPAVCIEYSDMFSDVKVDESLCKEPQPNIPALPIVTPVATFLGFNVVFAALSQQLVAKFNDNCSVFGAYNWWFAAGALQAFREDQRNRKQIIYALANSLGQPGGDFYDLDGASVGAGAETTFRKNLTFANDNSVLNFKMKSSFEGYSSQTPGGPPPWLAEIVVSPTMRYSDPRQGSGCHAVWQGVVDVPARSEAMNVLNSPGPAGLGATDLIPWATKGDLLKDTDYRYSLGVEKNPWYMAYVGVKAETAPRQIFFPIGPNIKLTARAFAKPFGGRIGPWYGSLWPQSERQSIGPKTDPFLPPRQEANGLMDMKSDPLRLPNYSRFPGDQLGLQSKLALASLRGYGSFKVSFGNLMHIWKPMAVGGYNDPLSFDVFKGEIVPMRYLELAAVAPDLFDITYYSIESSFGINYLEKLKANRQKLGIPESTPIRGDLGQNDFLKNYGFGVRDQLEIAAGKIVPPTGPLQKQEAFYFVRDSSNLLTGWTPGDTTFDYSTFPQSYFGHCGTTDEKFKVEDRIPGGCYANGGRTGYSVKLISRDALLPNTKHPIGGGQEQGPILNPPDL